MADVKHSFDHINFQFPAIQEGSKTVDLKKYLTGKIQLKTSFRSNRQ